MSDENAPAPGSPTVLNDKMIAYARVQVPSLGLLFFGLLGMFTILVFALDPLDRLDGRATRSEQKQEAAESGVEAPEGRRTGEEAVEVVPEEGSRMRDVLPPWLPWIVGPLSMIAGMITVVGAWRMRHLRSLRLARLACLCAVLPLNPLFCLSFVFGVWGAVVLFRDDVEEHFES